MKSKIKRFHDSIEIAGRYFVRPDSQGLCWVVTEKNEKTGKEMHNRTEYPARFDLALRNVLDRMARDGIAGDETLHEAVQKVGSMYATIGKTADHNAELLTLIRKGYSEEAASLARAMARLAGERTKLDARALEQTDE